MADHEEEYDEARIEALRGMLRSLAERIAELNLSGRLLEQVPELLQRLGDLRSELFHYEVRSTYDTPEVAEHRRIVDAALEPPEFQGPDSEDDQPWRHPNPD